MFHNISAILKTKASFLFKNASSFSSLTFLAFPSASYPESHPVCKENVHRYLDDLLCTALPPQINETVPDLFWIYDFHPLEQLGTMPMPKKCVHRRRVEREILPLAFMHCSKKTFPLDFLKKSNSLPGTCSTLRTAIQCQSYQTVYTRFSRLCTFTNQPRLRLSTNRKT